MKRAFAAVCAAVGSLLFCSTAGAQLAPVPAGSPTPVALPEIGRVRAVSPSCAAMRDLVIPSFKAAKDVDVRFDGQAAPLLPKYVQTVDEDPGNPVRGMYISRLDQQVSLMKEDLLAINRALGDPRLARPRDAQTELLRQKLQELYDAQSGRANILWEFVTRERVSVAKREAASWVIAARRDTGIAPSPTPYPGQTPTPYAMPSLNGIALSDQKTMSGWSSSLTAAARQAEDRSGRIFAAVAEGCR